MHNELSLSDLADALDRDDGHHDYECETCCLPLCTHLRLCREHGIEASAETVPGFMAVAGVHVCCECAPLWMGDGPCARECDGCGDCRISSGPCSEVHDPAKGAV